MAADPLFWSEGFSEEAPCSAATETTKALVLFVGFRGGVKVVGRSIGMGGQGTADCVATGSEPLARLPYG